MAKATISYLVVADFDYEVSPKRLALAGPVSAPAARATWGIASESRPTSERFQLDGESRALHPRGGGCKADMIQQPIWVVEAEQERSDLLLSMPLQIRSYLLKCSQMAVLCFGALD